MYKDQAFNDSFIYGKGDALDVAKSKGLNGNGNKLRVIAPSLNPYAPDFMAGYTKLTPTNSTGFQFSVDSKYVTSVKNAPPSYAYSSEFGAVPDLVQYWARREEWEIAIKKAIAAEAGQFDAKWDEMKAIVNKVCDYKKMEEDMTAIALPYYDIILAAQNQ